MATISIVVVRRRKRGGEPRTEVCGRGAGAGTGAPSTGEQVVGVAREEAANGLADVRLTQPAIAAS